MDHTRDATVRAAPERHRYELLDGEAVIGAAHYLDLTDLSPAVRIFYHTTVDNDHSGQGLGSSLAQFALEDTVRLGLVIVALCPFIKGYIQRHPQYQAHTLTARPEHFSALSNQLSNG